MSALGRKRTLISVAFVVPGRPLSGKADIKLILTKEAANDPLLTVGSDSIDRICDSQSGQFELASVSTAPEYLYCDRTMLH